MYITSRHPGPGADAGGAAGGGGARHRGPRGPAAARERPRDYMLGRSFDVVLPLWWFRACVVRHISYLSKSWIGVSSPCDTTGTFHTKWGRN